MLNVTTEIRFHIDGEALDAAIRESLRVVSDGMFKVLGMSDLNPDLITSKRNTQGAFGKFTRAILLNSQEPFDREWLSHLYHSYNEYPASKFPRNTFEEIFRCQRHPTLVWTQVFARDAVPGLGFTLLWLHVTKVITLPAAFDWPSKRNHHAYDALSQELCEPSELLSFFRSLDTPNLRGNGKPEEAFGRNAHGQYRAEWLGTRGTKVLLALGWHRPEDMDITDCVNLNKCIKTTRALKALVGTMTTLLNVIKAKFGDRAPMDGGFWMTHNRQIRVEINQNAKRPAWYSEAASNIEQSLDNLDSLYATLVETEQSVGNFENVKKKQLEGKFPFSEKYDFRKWFKLHDIFFKRKKYEEKRKKKNLIGVFGLYLFYYLPAWFEANPNSGIEYPDEPNKMLPGIFIARWMESEQSLPITLVEFISARKDILENAVTTQYQVLNQISVFFDFLQENSGLLVGCETFKNQLSRYDFPRMSKPSGTTKRAIPRQMFGPYIQYLFAIKSYYDLVIDRMLDGSFEANKYESLRGTLSVVDTFSESAREIGYVPVVFYNNRCIPVRYLPYQPGSAWYQLKDGRHMKLVYPHAINQILCALMTGLRHNHIQWLDARTFDQLVQDEDEQFTKLYVNTDKIKKTGWAPEVNMAVIHLLRSQKKWRDLIADEQFATLHDYNGNEDSIYEPILPLFAHGSNGAPHLDSMYYWAWSELLAGFQGFARDLFGDSDISKKKLIRLLPPKVLYNTPNLATELQQWSSTKGLNLDDNPKVELIPRSDITPHSSRISVVTHTLTFLPPEVIGQHITGQSPGTVLYYYKPDPEDARLALVHQGMHMRDLALQKQAVAAITDPIKNGAHHIQVDVNSVLARSIKTNLEGTIAAHGCISLVLRETDQAGIDILRERGVTSIAFNKTEICPYENNCPESIIKMLRGIRRCSLCPAAVRSIDHLPAIAAKKKQVIEIMLVVDRKLDALDARSKYNETELDLLEADRQLHAEDIAGWEASEQILEAQRARIASGADTRRWMVEKPEIIQEDLRKVETPNSGTTYLMMRLAESISYPGFQSEHIKAMIDNARRRILARAGHLTAALSNEIPVDPAAECAGLIRSLVEANGLTTADVVTLLDTDRHLQLTAKPIVLGIGYDEAA